MANHNKTGERGEKLALLFVKEKGMDILHTNFREGKNEVDIIASIGNTLHFIEVKTKAGRSMAQPESRVNSAKLGRMKQVAESYCLQNPGWKFVQFDILAITLYVDRAEEFFWIEDVF